MKGVGLRVGAEAEMDIVAEGNPFRQGDPMRLAGVVDDPAAARGFPTVPLGTGTLSLLG